MIINLQREFEHPDCCPTNKLEKNGFSYLSNKFENENIKVKYYGWKDLEDTDNLFNTLSWVAKIVKNIVNIVNNDKKVFIHCHSGLGRTCVIIACYIIFITKLNLSVHTEVNVLGIINELKILRPGCFKKQKHIRFCENFYEFISDIIITFKPHKLHIQDILNKQKIILFGDDAVIYHQVPRILDFILKCLIQVKYKQKYSIKQFCSEFLFLSNSTYSGWNEKEEEKLSEIKTKINNGDYSDLNENSELRLLVLIFSDWLEDSIFYAVDINRVLTLEGNILKCLEDIIKDSSNKNLLLEEHITINSIVEKLKVKFKKIEIEILFCISFFLSFVTQGIIKKESKDTDSECNDKNMYSYMSLKLLGEGIYNIREQKINEAERILTMILQLFVTIIKLKEDFFTNLPYKAINYSCYLNMKLEYAFKKQDKIKSIILPHDKKNKSITIEDSIKNEKIKRIKLDTIDQLNDSMLKYTKIRAFSVNKPELEEKFNKSKENNFNSDNDIVYLNNNNNPLEKISNKVINHKPFYKINNESIISKSHNNNSSFLQKQKNKMKISQDKIIQYCQYENNSLLTGLESYDEAFTIINDFFNNKLRNINEIKNLGYKDLVNDSYNNKLNKSCDSKSFLYKGKGNSRNSSLCKVDSEDEIDAFDNISIKSLNSRHANINHNILPKNLKLLSAFKKNTIKFTKCEPKEEIKTEACTIKEKIEKRNLSISLYNGSNSPEKKKFNTIKFYKTPKQISKEVEDENKIKSSGAIIKKIDKGEDKNIKTIKFNSNLQFPDYDLTSKPKPEIIKNIKFSAKKK